MRGKVFAVSGASSGLGRALALALARDGVLLSLLARDERRLQNTADECATIAVNNPPPHIFTGDIRGERECQQWITAAAAHFGRLDGLTQQCRYQYANSDSRMRGLIRFAPDNGYRFLGRGTMRPRRFATFAR